jgi:hypothetical protein
VVHSLGFAYHHAAIYALKHDDITAAREWAEKEIEVAIYCLGYDSPKVDFIGDWIAHNCAAPIEEVCKSN